MSTQVDDAIRRIYRPEVNTKNVALMTDSYKLTHWGMLDDLTQVVYSYDEPRDGAEFDRHVVHGLQYLLFEYLQGQVVTKDSIAQAAEYCRNHHGTDDYFNYPMWNRILNVHGGRLPISILAPPEGTILPPSNATMIVRNTDEEIIRNGGTAPLTNCLESLLLHTWHASTIATVSFAAKQMIKKHLMDTAPEDLGLLPYMLHDFGYRGVSSDESARTGGAAHLLNFYGTDTNQAVIHLQKYYGAKGFIGFSVAATEHSVMTQKGRGGEKEVLRAILTNPRYKKGIISIVGDSYNIYEFVNLLCTEFKDLVLAREPDGLGLCKVVVRPDSRTARHPIPGDQMAELSRMLANGFGTTNSSKGYVKLHPKVGIIWGDGIHPVTGVDDALKRCVTAGFAASNYVFGAGGGLLQKWNRDTQRFAFKCSAQLRNGEWVDVYKDPLDNSKVSKRGRLKLTATPGAHGVGYATRRIEEPGNDIMVEVFRDGEVKKAWNLEEMRHNTQF